MPYTCDCGTRAATLNAARRHVKENRPERHVLTLDKPDQEDSHE